MGLRFRRSIGFRGLRLNFTKSGMSMSAGGRGARVTVPIIGGRGITTTVGIPGSGFSYSMNSGRQSQPKSKLSIVKVSPSDDALEREFGIRQPKPLRRRIVEWTVLTLLAIAAINGLSKRVEQGSAPSSKVVKTIEENDTSSKVVKVIEENGRPVPSAAAANSATSSKVVKAIEENGRPVPSAAAAKSAPAVSSGAQAPRSGNKSVLSATAIAAILIQESRSAYYATGRPCACPEDVMRNGRRCAGNSAHSRGGGASPYCYVSDVPISAIEKYQARLSSNVK